jgi:hypothetical protein
VLIDELLNFVDDVVTTWEAGIDWHVNKILEMAPADRQLGVFENQKPR